MKSFLYTAVAVGIALAGAALATQPAQAAGRWRLDFKPGKFANVVSNGRAHYYMAYTLENNSGAARKPGIRIVVETDTDKSHGDHYDYGAYKAIAKRMKKTSINSTSRLRGTELADGGSAEGVAHFGRIDPNADVLTVKVYGLWDPVMRDSKGNVWSERRVLVATYRRSGDEYNRPSDPIHHVKTKQMVEGELVKLYGPE